VVGREADFGEAAMLRTGVIGTIDTFLTVWTRKGNSGGYLRNGDFDIGVELGSGLMVCLGIGTWRLGDVGSWAGNLGGNPRAAAVNTGHRWGYNCQGDGCSLCQLHRASK
jgi:hypothetical protein